MKYENKLAKVRTRIEKIQVDSFYCDYWYKKQQLDKRGKNITDIDERIALNKEYKYIELRFFELEQELKTLRELEAGYASLVD